MLFCCYYGGRAVAARKKGQLSRCPSHFVAKLFFPLNMYYLHCIFLTGINSIFVLYFLVEIRSFRMGLKGDHARSRAGDLSSAYSIRVGKNPGFLTIIRLGKKTQVLLFFF